MSKTNPSMIASLHEQAQALPADGIRLRLPLHVLLGEATDVARFFERYYRGEREPGTERVLRPGLRSVGKGHLPADTAARLLALVELIQAAHSEYQLATEAPQGQGPILRGRFVLAELTAALEFLFDDGVDDERDLQLARVQQANDDTGSTDALALALDDYAALARHYQRELDGFGDFDVAIIAEAAALAAALRERSARGRGEKAERASEAIERRNRLATVLSSDMARVRRAARFVFRHHPQIRREVSSSYERRTRAARRRAAAKEQGGG